MGAARDEDADPVVLLGRRREAVRVDDRLHALGEVALRIDHRLDGIAEGVEAVEERRPSRLVDVPAAGLQRPGNPAPNCLSTRR